MIWIMKCERCGKFFKYHLGDTNGVTLLSRDIERDRFLFDGDKYLLCPDCVRSWEDWFERGKAQKEEKAR